MSNIAVILAGGGGYRLGLDYPKQFATVAGKQIIEHTIEIFQSHPRIDEILIVSKPEYTQSVLDLGNRNHYSKMTKVVNGGDSRTDSTLAAIWALDGRDDDTNVLFHDAVRPFLSHSIIDRCLEALASAPAVDVVIGSADTIVGVNEAGFIESMPDRARLRRGQTPQGFKLGVIRQAYSVFEQRGRPPATCDCGVVFQSLPGVRIATVEGDASNIKITEPIDVFLADKLFQFRGDAAITDGSRQLIIDRLRDRVLVIFGGSYGIGHSIGEMARLHGATVCSFSRTTTGTDVADSASVSGALERVAESEGRIDFIVNTAAFFVRRPLMHMDPEEIHRCIDVNLAGTLNVARVGYPHLARTGGSLLLFTSSSYTRGRAFSSVYSASKAAVANLTQALAEEWEADGVKVNCLNPERTATPMRTRNFGPEPPDTLLTVEEVAEASLAVMTSGKSGHIVDVRLTERVDQTLRVDAIDPIHSALAEQAQQ
jgi:2-C-methyl-D-erythritol 4-phosphate cytidylyltransferase